VRRTVAQWLRTLDGWLPVRRMRMTWTVAAACAGYMALIALQLSLVAPPFQRAEAAAPVGLGRLLGVSDAGVCVLPVCLLTPTCVAGVGATCLLPLAITAPVQPAPRAPIGAAPAPVVPPRPVAAAAAPAPAVHTVRHVAVVPAAPPPKAPPAALVVTQVDRPVPAAALPDAQPPATGVALPAPPVAAVPAIPGHGGSPWWLYALFAAVDGAAAVALVVLVRRTSAVQARS